MTEELSKRTAKQVLEDHVRLREKGDLETDLQRNYDSEVIVLSGRRSFRGHDGMRESASLLDDVVEPDSYRFRALVASDRIGLAEWSAQGDEAEIRDGVDSYLVEGGRIRAQTIHYTVISSELSAAAVNAQPERRPKVRDA